VGKCVAYALYVADVVIDYHYHKPD
jgi:hypothetical protein